MRPNRYTVQVLSLHADQIAHYGGSVLVRDLGLLESALAMPAATFGGEFLHTS
jgi:death-on-curing protein